MALVRALQTRAVDLNDLRPQVVAPARALRIVHAAAQTEERAARESVARAVRIDGVHRKAGFAVHRFAFVLAYICAFFAAGNEYQFAEIRDLFNHRVHVLPAREMLGFIAITENDIAVVADQFLKIVFKPVNEKGIGKGERHAHSVFFRGFHGGDARFAGRIAGPQITLHVADLTLFQQIHVDVGRAQARGDSQVRAHGALGIGSGHYHAGSGRAFVFGERFYAETDSGLFQVAAIEFTVRVIRDFARIERLTARERDIVHRIGRGSAGTQLQALVLQIVEQFALAIAFDQGHDAFGDLVFFEECVFRKRKSIDDGVAHAEYVVFQVLIYTCHLFTFINRTLRATKMTGKGSPAAYSAKKICAWTAVGLGILIFHRLLFILLHWPQDPPAPDLLALLDQFWFGIAYDFATLPLVVLPLILALPLYALGRPGLNRALRWLEYAQWVYLCALNLTLLASTYNFTFNDKHLGWEFTAYIVDLGTLLGGISERSPLLLAGWALLLPALIGGGIWWLSGRPPAPLISNSYASAQASPADEENTKRGSGGGRLLPGLAGGYVLLLLFLVLSLRGGFQESPIRSPDAIRYGTSYLNTIPLNGLFTISRDAQDSSDFLKFFEQDENIAYVQTLLDEPAAFVSPEYPLVRRMPSRSTLLPGGQKAPNLVLIILESFTAKYLTVHGGNPEIAPEFDRLMREGRYYERFMASGGRSANGIFCMMAGLPDRANRTILRSNESSNRMGGLAKLLGMKGYHSLFVHGGDLRFDSMDRMLPHLGFNEAYGWREMESEGLVSDSSIGRSAWGYQDGDSFRVLENRLDALHAQDPERPLFASIFTLNTHHPFLIPDQSFAHFDASVGDQRDFLNSYRYTDRMLGEFMRAMREKPYYKDTIFILTADHAHHRGLNYLEDRHIPLLMYAPGKIAPERIPELASQLDILPTMLGLAGGDVAYAAMGRDLLAGWNPRPEQSRPFAYYAGGSNTGVIGWVEDELLLMQWIGTPHFIVMTARHPADQTNLYEQNQAQGDAMLAKSRHFHQFARHLERSNRIFPPAGALSGAGGAR